MHRTSRLRSSLCAIALATVAFQAVSADDSHPSNKWRIEVSESAHSDGVIGFVLTPAGGEPQTVTVNITKGKGENHIAREIRDAFKKALPPKAYDIEVDDGEDVLVKRRGKTPDFNLVLAESTAESVRIHIERE